MSTDPKRSLTVFCPLGLSNRLRVLLSGLALAEVTERQFHMLWPLTPDCAAPFADLFTDNWPVTTVAAEAVADLAYISGWFGQLPDLMVAPESSLVVGHPSWLIRPERFAGHDVLWVRCQRLFAELQLNPVIQERIDIFRRQHFRATMIGVHLRRGDLLRDRPDVAYNTDQALTAIDAFLVNSPEAGILLCTDDGAPHPGSDRPTHREGIREKFGQRYGERVLSPIPRSLDRSSSIAIQDAVFDLYLLRSCDDWIGTEGSSFSQMVMFGQKEPHRYVSGATVVYGRIERFMQRIGLYATIFRIGQQQFGKPLPFPTLLRYYSRVPLHWLRMQIHKK